MSRLIRVGVIGCGKIAEVAHLPAYRTVRKAKVMAVADTNPERAKTLAERFGVEQWYSDPQKIVERKDIDAIDLCLPPYLNSQYILQAVEAGKHIFCEKPMALTVKEAEEIISKVDGSSVKLMVGYNHRFEPAFRKIKELVGAGLLGTMVSTEATYAKCEPPDRYRPPYWRSDPLRGGGVLLDLACHKIDTLRWIVGKIIKVSALASSHLKGDVEDTAAIIMGHEGGCISSLSTSVTYTSPVRELDLFSLNAEKGAVRFSSAAKNEVQLYLKGALLGRTLGYTNLNISKEYPGASHSLVLESFFDSITKDVSPPVTAQDAKEVLRAVEAIKQSIKEGRTISLTS